MANDYFIYHSIPDMDVIGGIVDLHQSIFGISHDLIHKMANKPQLFVIIAMDGKNIIGYKIGYAIDQNKFYSWLGGVDAKYRKHGIATKLMDMQHQYLREEGYKVVRTKTMNKWRGMLLLNIKNGFDVIDTYRDEKGIHKIILEKSLIT
ncbi:GNAT family N-acetyltransferase [Pseudogracilibacillus auburnensis]|uniref:Putative GNAT family acetyltransferase n=1 Tax=Pseudogracilibacillus auburnensis TaxID=1494959 RepID=A0A2V3WBV2_9BACI|nr:GNAT family N-acetyltransferase [Pseudogracilibacillus auburnensis]PXW90678.1 putative GNAT family acetyltransferase [Pseudogracilibacillus auburnensis]